MVPLGPKILVVADNGGERAAIAQALGEAGFVAIAARAVDALPARGVAAAVIAAAGDAGRTVRALRAAAPALPLLVVAAPEMLGPGEPEFLTLVRRPLDMRELLERVFELVLRADPEFGMTPRRHSHAAELGIAAAGLACLVNRQALAAASGAGRLAHDLARQIGEVQLRCQRLAIASC